MSERSLEISFSNLRLCFRKYFIYFFIITFISVAIPFYNYYNQKTKYTSSIIIEPQNVLQLLELNEIWNNFYLMSIPCGAEINSDTSFNKAPCLVDLQSYVIANPYFNREENNLKSVLYEDFITTIKSPVLFYPIYQNFKTDNKINFSYDEMFSNIRFEKNVIKKYFLISYTAENAEHSKLFLKYIVNNVHSNMLNDVFNHLDILSQNLIQKEFDVQKYKELKENNKLRLIKYDLNTIQTDEENYNIIYNLLTFLIISTIINLVILILIVNVIKFKN